MESFQDEVSLYEENCRFFSGKSSVEFLNVIKLEKADSLFYTDVFVKEAFFQALLDSGSMTCTMNEEAEQILKNAGVELELSETQ